MKATEKAQLTNINKIPKFKIIMNKLTLQETLEEAEKEFILGCAILFIKYFEIDRRCKSYLELAYYIILKYSTTYGDYKPLYFFAVNFGFYPIAKNILDNNLIPNLAINDCLIDYGIEAFNNRGYIETLEQRNLRKSILSDESNEISFIAPTSFGKSSLINEHIQLNKYKNNKIGIIVPTKSLLIQTYRNIKKEISNYKFLIHDEMYQGERNFIAIFTQERALRLLNKNDVFFDVLYIDEAHNLFKASSRSILLTRLLKKNQVKNPEQKIIYLSPFIEDINSLKIESKQVISEKRITYNLKEPEIWEHRLNGDVYKYNRFVNEFYKENSKQEIFSYISSNLSEKNLFYVRSPKKIEQFAKELYSILPEIPNASSELKNLIGEIKEVLHEDFYLVKYLEKGILYLHGRLPDVVKEYLESKYSALKEIKYLIANTVILEGINLPIEKLFILSTHSLHESELTNLIGRVNRLNNIFTKGENNLEKLLPQIYFVNHEIFNQKNSKMENKIKQLRSNVFLDEVKNPLLTSFDWNQSEEKVTTSRKVLANEEFLFANELKDIDFIKKSFIENGLNEIYKMSDDLLEIIYKRTITIKEQDNWINQNLIDK
ncbi:DEAD/DEAH box helicase, partial [Anaerospora hongkongensis]|uniref:DEAD/DEAH box helicase n=1 Tax=Anaerospora hongkongensis TaxID=244830 RepID=UPI002FDB1205